MYQLTLSQLITEPSKYGANASATDYLQNMPRYIRITDIDEDGKLSDESVAAELQDFDEYLLKQDDLLFARTGNTVGKTYLYDEKDGKCIYAGYLIRFRLDKKIVFPKYVFYFTKSKIYKKWINHNRRLGAQPNINSKIYSKLKIPILTIPEQRRVIELLDHANELKEKRKKADDIAERIIPALFYNVFGDPIDLNDGDRLDIFCEQDKKINSEGDNENLIYIGLEHIESKSVRIKIADSEKDRNAPKSTTFHFNEEHVLYGRLRPYLNKVALPNFTGRCTTELIPLKPIGVSREYLATLLRLPQIVNFINQGTIGARMPRANMKRLMSLNVCKPSLEKVKIFTRRYKDVSKLANNTQVSSEKLDSLFNLLIQKAFNGDLTADWREAHMEELLQEMEQQMNYLETPLSLEPKGMYLMDREEDQRPQYNVKVIGVGNSGKNAVDHMINSGMKGISFKTFEDQKHKYDYESIEKEITPFLKGADLVFITAGMGGKTCSHNAPLVAQAAKALGIQTVGVVTLPANFESTNRMNRALYGISEMNLLVGVVIVIPLEKVLSMTEKNENVTKLADSIIYQAVKCITDLIDHENFINLDLDSFEDIFSTYGVDNRAKGNAKFGVGIATGRKRAIVAAQRAISSPLLGENGIKKARNIMINVSGGNSLTLHDVDEATSVIFEEANEDAYIIFGAAIDPAMGKEIRVTVIGTLFNIEEREQKIKEDIPIKLTLEEQMLYAKRRLKEQIKYLDKN